MHLLRIVLNSGSMTELMFDREDAMSDARDVMRTTAMAVSVPDDYGHEMYAEPSQIAAIVCVDLEQELKGQSTMTYERQMMQDRLAERVYKSRDLVSPQMMAPVRPNGAGTIIRG